MLNLGPGYAQGKGNMPYGCGTYENLYPPQNNDTCLCLLHFIACYGRPYVIVQTIIFLPSDFYLLLSFFSSPNLSRRRLDVCHTSTHGVALVRIKDAGLKPATH